MRQVKSGLTWRVRWVLVGLAVVIALPAFAGIRGPTVKVDALSIDGHNYGVSWEISSPTLCSSSGYLAYDASGKSPKVTFRREKGPGTEWFFFEVLHFKRQVSMGRSEFWYISEEQTGYTMKIRAAEGPFKGWYLARVDGALVLVKNHRDAATLRMLEKTVEIKSR
jgi:hypothetical protein